MRKKTKTLHLPFDKKTINSITLNAWPKKYFNQIEGVDIIKDYCNTAYRIAELQLIEIMQKYHPISWIIEAYQQLQVWTMVKEGVDPNLDTSIPDDLYPIGRYGWRYVIEKSIEYLAEENKFYHELDIIQDIPEEVNSTIFTLLFIMGQTSEVSNFMHVLNNRFIDNPSISFAPNSLLSPPKLSETDNLLFNSILESVQDKEKLNGYDSFLPSNSRVIKKVDDFLKKNYNLSFSLIEEFGFYLTSLSNEYKASTLIIPLSEFVESVVDKTSLDFIQTLNILKLAFLDIENLNNYSRDFLRKSEQDRMLNYAGIIFNIDLSLLQLQRENTLNESSLIIISPLLIPEWANNFLYRLALGRRSDLKHTQSLKLQISEIESFYRKNIFENEVMELLRNRDFFCFNLDKFENKKIPCGEIDIIAYRVLSNELYILECKALAPITDARAMGQVISDHYYQKKYHEKFLKKIDWLRNNEYKIKCYIRNYYKENINEDNSLIKSYYISCYYNPISNFQENEYKAITFYELDKELTERYQK